MEKQLRVLLVDDDEDEYFLLKTIFARLPGQGNGFRYVLDWAATYDQALEACGRQKYDVHLVDYHLGRYNGLDLMRAVQERGCGGPFILLTGQGSYELDLAAMEQGAADYLSKDQMNEYLLERSIRYAIESAHAQEELERRVRERTQELAESEERFRTLAETTSAAIFIVQDLKIRYANPATRFVTGYTPEELLGEELWKLAHPNYQNQLKQSRMVSQWAAGIPARYEIKIINRNGEERWVDVTAGSMLYEGKPAWLFTAFDITERDLAEQALRRSKEELERRVKERTMQFQAAAREAQQRADELDGLQRATASLLSTLELDELLCQILDAAQSAIPAAEKGALHLVSPSTGQLQVRAILGFSDERIRVIHSSRSQDIPARVVRERKPMLVHDVQAEGLPEGTPEEMRDMRSIIIAPLDIGGQVLGTLSLSATKPQAFTGSNLRLLVSFAATTTAALQNAILHAEIKQLAVRDPLTGVYNRRAFFDLGQREIERFQRFFHPLSAIMIDLDNFKHINDTFGHAAGDQILRLLSERCLANIRETDIFGRYGGDEFAILLPDTDLFAATQIANRILEATSATSWLGSQDAVTVTVSMGVARARRNHRTLEELLADADKALYRAKTAGRNRLEVG